MSNSSGVLAAVAVVGDTWGVPGPTFLGWYGVAAALAFLLTLFLRYRGGFRRQAEPPEVTPEQAAYLAGGSFRTFYSAVAALRMTGRLTSSGRLSLAATGPVRLPGESPLQAAIVLAAGSGRSTTAVRTHTAVVAALAGVGADVQRSGLIRTSAQRWDARAGVWPLLVVLGVGVARLMAAGGHPVGYLVAIMVGIVVAAIILLVSVPQLTPLGRAALSRARQANRHLSVGRSPSWTAYGPPGLAMSVALFGSAALFSVDPAFADEIGVPRVLANTDGGSGLWVGGSADGGSSGSSCGGGGGGGGRRLTGPGDRLPFAGAAPAPDPDFGLDLGVGIGWRPEIEGVIADLPGLRFVEVVAEALTGDRLPDALSAFRDRGVTVIPHGTRLSLGGAEPVPADRLAQFAAAARLVDAPLVSEHIAFVRAGGVEAGHLLPLPRSRAAVDAVVANVALLRRHVDVAVALEPIAAVFDWPDDELTEGQFLTEILDRTGALLLLDVANSYANAVNRGTDPAALLDELPLDRIAYVHVAGGSQGPGAAGGVDGVYHDTHTDAVPQPVLDLLSELCARCRPPGIMLERDGDYPPAAELHTELDAIADHAGRPRITRG